MFKLFLCIGLILSVSKAAASNGRVYRVVYHVIEMGKKTGSSSLIISEGQAGEVKTSTENGDENSLKITVNRASEGSLSADYRFRIIQDKKNFEFAKLAVAFAPGKPEINKFKDSSGNDFEISIVIDLK